MLATLTDEELLLSQDPEAFGVFYARHLEAVERYFARRVGREAAADLAAETFASALVSRRRFRAGASPAAGWLYTIATRRLVDYRRRGLVRERTLETLASEAAIRDPPASPGEIVVEQDPGLLRHLPDNQRGAIIAHIIEDRDYKQVAAESHASEVSVRQRVSRGLSALRGPLQIYRAAQDLSREDHTYRFGGGHRKELSSIGPLEPLDCSSSASLILFRSGLLTSGTAWTSGELAERWGEPGEGQYVTVWANEEHVWIEFKLDADHGERFDPTPSRQAPSNRWIRRDIGPTRDFVPRRLGRL